MAENIKIRRYKEGDEKQIISLLEQGFDGWPKTTYRFTPDAYWQWKFMDNPLGVVSIHLAVDGDKIVGCDHASIHKIKILDKVHLCSCQGDMTVHPGYRGRGIWRKIREHELDKENDINLVHLMTGNPIVIKGFTGVRPQFSHRLSNMVLIKDLDRHLEAIPADNEWLIKLGFGTLTQLNKLRQMLRSGFGASLDIETVSEFPSDVDDLWEIASPQYKFIVERKQSYLNWRYCDERSDEFVVKIIRKNGVIQGYIVFGVNRYIENYPIGYIVDMLVRPRSPHVADALFKEALRVFDEEDINIINFLVINDHPFQTTATNNGFLDSRITIHMFYNTEELEEEMEQVVNFPPRELYFMWGDHDSLPVASSRV